jgi:malonyl-ACP decarboxylase
MPRAEAAGIAVTGLGIVSAIGTDAAAFQTALLQGQGAFGVMQRPGRQIPVRDGAAGNVASAFLGAELPPLQRPLTRSRLPDRRMSLSAQAALHAVDQAWTDAGLDEVPPQRIGLVVGGCNVQQRELVLMQDQYRGREEYLRPTYGMSFIDTDLCGVCTEAFDIRGRAWTVGGASASGQLAVIEAAEAVRSGRVDVCIAVGALMDLSYWECQGLRALGAMGSERFADAPDLACRAFDTQRDGFIFGEACAAVVLEREDGLARHVRTPYARLAGWRVCMDAHRNPDPSADGETAAVQGALAAAGLDAADIDYVNPHGTGSPLGDVVELESLRRCHLTHAWINATKPLTGHGLTAAGATELVAILLQMQAGRLHPVRNLEAPIDDGFRWVGAQGEAHRIQNAINLSMGFGGMNTAVCVQRWR